MPPPRHCRRTCVAILTTNAKASFDEAFMRRIRFKLDFQAPDAKARQKLWQTLVPPHAPIDDDINWAELGDGFELTGGHIRNAILRAAIDAAATRTAISHTMLHNAAVAESREMGHLVRNIHPTSGERDPWA